MAKFVGAIGFSESVETEPGIWEDKIVERVYSGDLFRNVHVNQSSGSVNDNINLSNEISIIADPFAEKNFQTMRYVVFAGNKWKITNINVQYPRLKLTVGGVYNGQ